MPAKVLFVLHDATQSRHFFSVFQELVSRGCEVHLRVFYFGEKELKLPKYLRHIPELKIAPLKIRSDIWGKYARAFRGTRNYLLYEHPKFPEQSIFRERAWEWTDPFLRKGLRKSGKSPRWFRRYLESIENAIPPDPDICAEVREGGFSVVLVSPYIFYQNTFHNDYVRAAHAVGVPVGFPVFSWDNLTTKGNLHILPDRVWVWNDTQKQELIEYHGVPPNKIGVTGAYRFDEYREMPPSVSREGFCERLGLDPHQAIIAYLGSSPAVAPDEGAFVNRWLEQVRKSDDSLLARASILVRSHPRNVAAWRVLDGILKHENVAFQEPVASNFWETQDLRDLLTYADAAVGLNTSAMLEASIHGLPVHSVLEPSVRAGQEGAVHFEYLTTAGGGLLHLDASVEDHVKSLARSLARTERPDPRSRRFFEAFIDSGEDARTPTGRMADEIEALAAMEKSPARRRRRDDIANTVWSALLRMGMPPVQADPDYETAHGDRIS